MYLARQPPHHNESRSATSRRRFRSRLGPGSLLLAAALNLIQTAPMLCDIATIDLWVALSHHSSRVSPRLPLPLVLFFFFPSGSCMCKRQGFNPVCTRQHTQPGIRLHLRQPPLACLGVSTCLYRLRTVTPRPECVCRRTPPSVPTRGCECRCRTPCSATIQCTHHEMGLRREFFHGCMRVGVYEHDTIESHGAGTAGRRSLHCILASVHGMPSLPALPALPCRACSPGSLVCPDAPRRRPLLD